MKYLFCCTFVLLAAIAANSQTSSTAWEHKFWAARWVAAPDALPNEFGVFHFRKELDLGSKPSSYIIHVSADNLYKLQVNGKMVASGPARSDPANWNYETLDIAAYLNAGKNIITATVWNFADFRAYAQTSFETAFIVQGNSSPEFALNTPGDWKVIWDKAYQPLPIDRASLRTYLAVASGEIVDGNLYSWGFDKENSGLAWKPVKVLWYPAKPRSFGTDGNWQLVPRSIPLPEEKQQEFSNERSGYLEKLTGNPKLAESFPWNIPANTRTSLLLDQGVLTNAFPQLVISSGKNATILLTYAEALIDSNRVKGNRNEVKGKKLIGISDKYISDGGAHRLYSPLHYRTFRYVKVDIQTGNDPFVI